ncbi:hypothetical protein AYK61_26045 [Rhodococcus sp. SBT000017]|jgi:transposase|uniref:hypothetical protein n=1 Tax=Rhodococcus sp. SBT000017 TaxID=1803385 RepID=UPI000EF8F9C8|nr:hypothetical protein [Rhodococcus sp. SBT000017]RMB70198.1 hypothetical protein AYK61_26045 [Rhodococcus sp. SBT000017]
MAKRFYTTEFRDKCLALVGEQMKTASSREEAVVAVAAALQIPVTTLRNWVRHERGAARVSQFPADTELAVRELRDQVTILQRALGRERI